MSWSGKGMAVHLCALLLCGILLAGCGAHRVAVPVDLLPIRDVPEYRDIRFYGDTIPNKDAMDRIVHRWAAQAKISHRAGDMTVLSLSGGGADGAFGAGFLNGWTAHGDRPVFSMVTGVSTGALIAPFAFLGPQYDPVLRTLYTTFSTDDLVRPRPIGSALAGDSLLNTAGFKATLKKYITADLIHELAVAHRMGRRLFIGTTNLDEMRPVYWDIGAIAQFDTPQAHQLIRDIMLASASIPVAFPPMYFTVEADGKRYDEMHVDGGVTNQVFAYPPAIRMNELLKRMGIKKDIVLYIIRNDALVSKPVEVQPNLGDIASRSLSGLIRNQGIGDLYRIYATAQRDGADFNLAYIPPDFQAESDELFDPKYMSQLFTVAEELAQSAAPWHKTPPEDLNPQHRTQED